MGGRWGQAEVGGEGRVKDSLVLEKERPRRPRSDDTGKSSRNPSRTAPSRSVEAEDSGATMAPTSSVTRTGHGHLLPCAPAHTAI